MFVDIILWGVDVLKRICCLLISLIFILGCFPASVFAAPGAPIIIVPGYFGSKLYSDSEFNERVFGEYGNAAEFLTVEAEELYVKEPVNLQKAAEFGAGNKYKALCNNLSLTFPKRKIYFFSYDFTKGTKDAAARLNSFINSLGGQVDMICHSYGGMVAAHYFAMDNSNYNKVDKAVFIGTPFEGSVYASLAVDNKLIAKEKIGELLPTKKYLEKVEMTADSGIGQDFLYSDGKSVMLKKDAYYAIGGGKLTASKIVYNEDGSITDILFDNNGDGIVTNNSATIYNEAKNVKTFNVTHDGLISSADVIAWATAVINNKAEAAVSDHRTGYDVVKINGDANVVISGGMGVMEEESTPLVQNEYGQLITVNDKNKIAALVRSDSAITLTGNNDGVVNLYIRRYDQDNKMICDNAFMEIPVTKETVVKTVVDDNEMWLYIDKNNDGVFEENACSKKNGEYYFTTRTPVPSVKEGTYNKSFKLTLESGTENAAIYYTLDGTDPLENGVMYEGEIKIEKTCTLKAVAVRENYTTGEVLEASYKISKIGFIITIVAWLGVIAAVVVSVLLAKKKKKKSKENTELV